MSIGGMPIAPEAVCDLTELEEPDLSVDYLERVTKKY